jgi:hypothetical protein
MESEEMEVIQTLHQAKAQLNNFSKLKTEDSFEQIDLKIDKEDIFIKDDFYSNPNKSTKTISNNFNITNKYKRIGNTLVFWYNKEGHPIILIGPHCM